MPIAADKTGMKRGRQRTGVVPLPTPAFIDRLMKGIDIVRRSDRGYGDDDQRPMSVEGADFRHSDAAGCARARSYAIQHIPQSNPPAPIDLWNMHLGTVIGEFLARAAAETMPGALAEVRCSHTIEREGAPTLVTAGHADVFAPEDPEYGRLCVEFKSQGGFAFKKHAGIQGTAEGPAWGAIVQGALCATAPEVNADAMMVVDVAKELTSVPVADGYGIDEDDPARGFAGWIFDRDYCEQVTQRELTRVRRIHEHLEAGQLVPRQIDDPEIPAAARITDPSTGTWQVRTVDGQVTQVGTYWNNGAGCTAYCSYRDLCIADGP